MSKDRNCLSCDNYKDEYCSVVDMKPYYPERGCDYFEARMSNIQEICDIDEMSKRVKCNPTGTYEEMVTFQLGAIATMLADISKSLAILADKAESEDKE